MTIAAGPVPQSAIALQRQFKSANKRAHLAALGLIAPLAIFLLLVFIVPIVALLGKAVQNKEVVRALPHTLAVLSKWDRKDPPPVQAYLALVDDLGAGNDRANGEMARRLNIEVPGALTLINKTANALPLTEPGAAALDPQQVRDKILKVDPRWSDIRYWHAIAKNGSAYTPYYLLAALDHRQDDTGAIVEADSDHRIFLRVFSRTFLISAVVTLAALLLGYPLSYWISLLPARKANLALMVVLIPFWTSILVRAAAWIVLLQREGILNRALIAMGAIDHPLTLLFNRPGVYISMTHILLPFMILPLYSVMKSIPNSYVRAAVSLGSHPFAAFWRVYVPQTIPGVGAGALLVFILALGYYITPALLGGPDDQMVSYYVAYFTNTMINWGMACALAALLLIATLVLFTLYQRAITPKQRRA